MSRADNSAIETNIICSANRLPSVMGLISGYHGAQLSTMLSHFTSLNQFIIDSIERLKQEMPTAIDTRRWSRTPESSEPTGFVHPQHPTASFSTTDHVDDEDESAGDEFSTPDDRSAD